MCTLQAHSNGGRCDAQSFTDYATLLVPDCTRDPDQSVRSQRVIKCPRQLRGASINYKLYCHLCLRTLCANTNICPGFVVTIVLKLDLGTFISYYSDMDYTWW